ncbi:MAG TPA: PKD domain-containing protein [Anaerolineae bacterium]|nr:PKD domain-containing protein [Anaerolineae bacterium]
MFIVWGDPAPESTEAGRTLYHLITDDGRQVQLLLDEAPARLRERLLDLNKRRVAVQGQPSGAATRGASAPVLVQAIELLPEPESAVEAAAVEGVDGSQPWVSLMCKFADVPDEPRSLSYFQGMYASTFPGEDHYWREVSYGAIDLLGSAALGWYTLPRPWSYYVYDSDGDGTVNLDHARAATDCIAAADPDVYYPAFVGINLMFNASLDCCAWGGGWYLDLDGVAKGYHITWEPPWGYENVTVISHEMGHGFGLPHSSGDYGQVYDNQWDVMSDTWANCASVTDPTYGCVGQDTISYHLDRLGWIAPARKAVVERGNQVSITLEQIDQPQTGGYLMAQVPVDNLLTHFFTVEARRKVGYDYKLPGEGVIIHEVITGQPEPAHVVDADLNWNTGDAGAIWSVGETFTDPGSGIWVRVNAATATGWVVTVHNPEPNPIEVDSQAQSPGGAGDCTLGEAIRAANTDKAVDGCNAGHGADRIIVPAGTYALTNVDNIVGGNNGLPRITSAILLEGAGRELTIIQREPGAPPFRIFYIAAGGGLEATGITVRNGDAQGGNGGGLYAAGSLTLSSSALSSNRAYQGGGVYVAAGVTAGIANTRIRANTSTGDGGGVFSEGTASIVGSAISGNTSGANAAGVQNWLGILTLTSSVLEDNVAQGDGSGVLGLGGVTAIDGCTFTDNAGAAVFDNSGVLQIVDTTVQSETRAGTMGVVCFYCDLTVDGSVAYNNDAGAFFAYSGEPLRVNNSCIAGNGDISVNNTGATVMDARDNWWGEADGPSGAAGGHGDSVSTNVTYVPFLEERPEFCPGLEPTAGFTGTPTSGPAPLEVQFANEASGQFDTCSWDFGDGGTSAACDGPLHAYAETGVYTVTLTVSGPGGTDTEIRPSYVTVYEPVQAAFLGNPTSGLAPLLVTFANESTGPYDSCAWAYGDGAAGTACDDPTHTYAQTGTYTVSLTVSGLGMTDTLTQSGYVTVYEAVHADFASDLTRGRAPLLVTFSNRSTGDYDTCAWTFGDGATSSDCDNPAHTFTSAGTYTVALTVSGPGGTIALVKPGYVVVLPAYSLYLPVTLH